MQVLWEEVPTACNFDRAWRVSVFTSHRSPLHTRLEKHAQGSRVQPRRDSRRPKARATGGGRKACTSSRPRAAALLRAASWRARNRCHRKRGVPAAGSCSKYVSAVRRSKTAILTCGALTLADDSDGELRSAASLP